MCQRTKGGKKADTDAKKSLVCQIFRFISNFKHAPPPGFYPRLYEGVLRLKG